MVPPVEVDAANAEELRALLLGAPEGADVVLDGSGVSYFDSSGLSVLVEAARRQAQAGGSLALRGASPFLRRVVSVAGLADLLGLTAPDPPDRPPAGVDTPGGT